MREAESDVIGYNEFGRLDEVFHRAEKEGIVKPVGSRGGRRRPHPINNQEVVLQALDRDDRFEKFYIRCCDRSGIKEMLVREFRLKDKELLKTSIPSIPKSGFP